MGRGYPVTDIERYFSFYQGLLHPTTFALWSGSGPGGTDGRAATPLWCAARAGDAPASPLQHGHDMPPLHHTLFPPHPFAVISQIDK